MNLEIKNKTYIFIISTNNAQIAVMNSTTTYSLYPVKSKVVSSSTILGKCPRFQS